MRTPVKVTCVPNHRDKQGRWVRSATVSLGQQIITPLGQLYQSILNRCRPGNVTQMIAPRYQGATFEFQDFQDFAEWASQQIGYGLPGYEIDKDILQKGNRAYTRDLCVFVPAEVNTLFCKANTLRGDTPIGVSFRPSRGKFVARMRNGKQDVFLGNFDTEIEAFRAYATAKELRIAGMAEKYRESIDPRAFKALRAYRVEIID